MIYTEIFHCSLLLFDRFSSVGVVGFLQYVFHTHRLMYVYVSFYVCIWWTKKITTTYIHLSSRRFLHTWGHLNCWFSYNQINGYLVILYTYIYIDFCSFIRTYTYTNCDFDSFGYSFFIHSKACNINHFLIGSKPKQLRVQIKYWLFTLRIHTYIVLKFVYL